VLTEASEFLFLPGEESGGAKQPVPAGEESLTQNGDSVCRSGGSAMHNFLAGVVLGTLLTDVHFIALE
jgi:hypothetical protein